jgi:hypothetical protein
MKRILSAITAFTLLLVFILAACKKNKDEAQAQDVEALLLNKNWKLTAFTVSPSIDFGNGLTNDVLSNWDSCDKDDLYVFKPNNVFLSDEGPTKCNPGEPQQSMATWSYNKTNKLLTYCVGTTGACDSHSWTITEINDNQFKATYPESINNIAYTLNVTFTKQ